MTPTVRLALIVVGSAVYLCLAVLCWGGLAAFFSHPALVAVPVVLFVMGGAAFFAGGNLSPRVREDRSNRWVFAAFSLIGPSTRPPVDDRSHHRRGMPPQGTEVHRREWARTRGTSV